ncbi:hypothetical protein PV326_001146, partial [Microctonus aethiopoides]
GQIYEASGWFKDALQINNEHRVAWSLLGKLHLEKMEWGPAQKIFERILKNPSSKNDTYALTALGNISLHTLHQSGKDKNREKRHQDRALAMYEKVLHIDPNNIRAANGIGVVLAHKGYLNEAEVLQYLARAYFKAGKFKEAKMTLLKACRVAPQDTELLYNVALVLQRLAEQILKDEKSTLTTVLQAVHELELSHKYFQYLATLGDSMKQLAEPEVRECQDLLLQAQYHVARARRLDEEEKMLRRKLEDEKQAFKLRQAEEQQKLEELRRQKEKEILQKRQEYIQKTKNIRVFGDMPTEKTPGKKGRRPRTDQYVSDCDGLGGEERREDAAPREKKKRKISSKGLSRGKGKKRNEERSGSESDRRRAKRARKLDSGKNGRKLAPEVTRNNSRFLSKETISTSESESDKDVNNKQVVMR